MLLRKEYSQLTEGSYTLCCSRNSPPAECMPSVKEKKKKGRGIISPCVQHGGNNCRQDSLRPYVGKTGYRLIRNLKISSPPPLLPPHSPPRGKKPTGLLSVGLWNNKNYSAQLLLQTLYTGKQQSGRQEMRKYSELTQRQRWYGHQSTEPACHRN